MPKYFYEFEQRSAKWHEIRLGRVTASNAEKILTAGGKPSSQAEAYMMKLLSEWAIGESSDSDYSSRWMEHGQEQEDAAVQAFEFQMEIETRKVGFVLSDDGNMGCSPDRLVGDDAILEIKSPAPFTQLSYLLNKSVADEYFVQIQFQLMLCERERGWVSSFHPKLPPIILPIERNEEFIKKLRAATATFVDVMLRRRAELETRFGPFVRPEPKRTEEAYDWLGVSMEDVDAFVKARDAAR